VFYKHSATARGVRVNAPSVVTGSIARSQNDGIISSVRRGGGDFDRGDMFCADWVGVKFGVEESSFTPNFTHRCTGGVSGPKNTQHSNSSAQCDLLLALYIEQRNQTALCHVMIGGG